MLNLTLRADVAPPSRLTRRRFAAVSLAALLAACDHASRSTPEPVPVAEGDDDLEQLNANSAARRRAPFMGERSWRR